MVDRGGSIARGMLVAALVLGPVCAAHAEEDPAYSERGEASWYGPGFAGEETASGLVFDPSALTAAHPDLPLGTSVNVTNLDNGEDVQVEIIDRGPYADGRVIDLSTAAGKRLEMIEEGTVPVRIEATSEQLREGRSDDVGPPR